MLRSYVLVAWRNMLRNRGYAAINIIGLAIGIACFMFIFLYVQHELSYDEFHEKGDQIYRIALERKYPGRSRHYAIIPASYSEVAVKDFPEVLDACRLFYSGNVFDYRVGEQLFEEQHLLWADSNFFQIFSISLLEGDARTCLLDPNSVVLTESLAERLFGGSSPIGQELVIPQGQNNLRVTGVCADIPENSHLRFNMLLSSNALGFIRQPNYINFSAYTYLLLHPDAEPSALEAKFPEWIVPYISGQALQRFGVSYEEYQAQGNGYRYFLQPLPQIYLKSNLEAEMKPPGSQQRVYFFTLIALLIIGIASINYMNLATARSSRRAREVGIRKTLGSSKQQIAGQFLSEAVIIALAAAAIAAAINYAALDHFNQLTGKEFSRSVLGAPRYYITLFLISAATGLLSGIYPALALSSFRPAEVLKGRSPASTGGASMRNALVIFQFAISVFLIICTILIYQQWSYTQAKALGFDKESVVNLQGAGNMNPQQSETLKNALRDLPGVVAVSGCSQAPGGQYFGVSFTPQGDNESIAGSGLIVDNGYLECMGMELIEGRGFTDAFTDSLSLVLNEAAVRELDLSNPVGTRLMSQDEFLNDDENNPSVYTVVGVVRDFHFQSLHHVISPVYIIHNHRSFNPGVDNLVTIRLLPTATANTLERIEQLWNQFQPQTPFRYAFLDADWAALYEKELTTRRIASLFSLIAIAIACLGLFALAAFVAERRTKEIGIRKVLGASVPAIVAMLARDFIKLVLIGILIAAPIAWFVMDGWLQTFVYRISIVWWVFAAAAIIALLIAFATVSYQSFRAAVANPVNALKTD